jgi:hypothetical protein
MSDDAECSKQFASIPNIATLLFTCYLGDGVSVQSGSDRGKCSPKKALERRMLRIARQHGRSRRSFAGSIAIFWVSELT